MQTLAVTYSCSAWRGRCAKTHSGSGKGELTVESRTGESAYAELETINRRASESVTQRRAWSRETVRSMRREAVLARLAMRGEIHREEQK
jgi:hypothetical protein